MIDPDNFTVSSDLVNICVQGTGAWRPAKMTVLPLFSRAEQLLFRIPVHVPAGHVHKDPTEEAIYLSCKHHRGRSSILCIQSLFRSCRSVIGIGLEI